MTDTKDAPEPTVKEQLADTAFRMVAPRASLSLEEMRKRMIAALLSGESVSATKFSHLKGAILTNALFAELQENPALEELHAKPGHLADTQPETQAAFRAALTEQLATLGEVEQKERAALLDAKIAELPQAQRPEAGAEHDALAAKLSLEAQREHTFTGEAWRALLERNPGDLEFYADAYRLALEEIWPGVFEAWKKEQAQRGPRLLYRHPILGIGRGLAGRRHGTTRDLPVRSDATGRTVELLVPIRGTQSASLDLSLAVRSRVVSKPTDFEPDGTIKQDALLRWVSEAVGPKRSRMLAAGFALAERDAQAEGRKANGSFWWSPTLGADLLGYKRVERSPRYPNGRRIDKAATAQVRSDFETLAGIVIRHPLWHWGKEREFKGTLFSPLRATLEDARRKHGQRGRDRQTLWQILPPLWEWSRRHFVATPIDLLHAGTERPDVWANCIRLWEVLGGYARHNAKAASEGDMVRSLESLEQECNLWPEGRKTSPAADLLAWARKLEARGYLEGVQETTLADGKTPGLSYRLPEPRRAELAAIAAKARARALPRPSHTGKRKPKS